MKTPYLVYFLLIISALAVGQSVSTNIEDPYPISINSTALVYESPGGKIIDTIYAGNPVMIYAAQKGFINVSSGKKSGWINMKHVSSISLIASDFIPGSNSEGIIRFYNNCENDTPGKTTVYYYGGVRKTPKSLFTFNSDRYGDSYDPMVRYWIFYTGIPEQPFMMLFGGHSSDMHHEIPVLVLFGEETTTVWYPNEGNRIISEFITFESRTPIISEAYYCVLSVQTQIKISKGEVKRIKGIFPKKEYTKSELNEEGLSADIILTKNNKTIATIKKGTVVEKLEMLEADFNNDTILIRINEKTEGWLPKSKFLEAFPEMYNIACCGCG